MSRACCQTQSQDAHLLGLCVPFPEPCYGWTSFLEPLPTETLTDKFLPTSLHFQTLKNSYFPVSFSPFNEPTEQTGELGWEKSKARFRIYQAGSEDRSHTCIFFPLFPSTSYGTGNSESSCDLEGVRPQP